MTASKRFSVLIVDDHPLVRRGLTQLLNGEPNLEIVAQTENAVEALAVIGIEHVDVAIVDISLNGMDGLKLTSEIKRCSPWTSVLILTCREEQTYVKRAFRAGAQAYITKQETPETVLTTLRMLCRYPVESVCS